MALACLVAITSAQVVSEEALGALPLARYSHVLGLLRRGSYVHALREAEAVLQSGVQDAPTATTPCMHHMLGLARYYTRDLEGARVAFARAIVVDSANDRTWVNFAECSLFTWHVEDAIHALEELVVKRGRSEFASKL